MSLDSIGNAELSNQLGCTSVLDRADTLKKEADALLYGKGIDALLRSFGGVFYTGSYSLDLLAWRDIDIHVVLEPDPVSLARFWEMGTQVAQFDGVYRCNFLNTCCHLRPNLPPGFYWGIKLDTEQATTWKIDIWATTAEFVEQNQKMMRRIVGGLADDTRRLILELKHALMLPEGRTPIMSGLHIYEAVLFKGLRDIETIRSYLREQKVSGV